MGDKAHFPPLRKTQIHHADHTVNRRNTYIISMLWFIHNLLFLLYIYTYILNRRTFIFLELVKYAMIENGDLKKMTPEQRWEQAGKTAEELIPDNIDFQSIREGLKIIKLNNARHGAQFNRTISAKIVLCK